MEPVTGRAGSAGLPGGYTGLRASRGLQGEAGEFAPES